MKKTLLYIAALFAIVSCEQFDEIKDVEPIGNISFGVNITLKKDSSVPAPASYKVKLNNYAENIEIIKEIPAGDILNINDVIPGIYTVAISGESTANGFTYMFNGNLSNVYVLDNGKQLDLEMAAARSGSILFKEIYYSGSKKGGKTNYFRDQFYELYNNSNQVQYLDGLCIGNLFPINATSNKYTWERPDADNYVYFESIWQVPFDRTNPNNKKYPLQPGESVILAQMAVDHTAENFNPDSPVNLQDAEFEFYLKTTANTFDNTDCDNMIPAYWKKSASTAQWMPSINGPALAIFYPDEQMAAVMYDPDYEQIYSSTWVLGNKTNKGKDVFMDCIVDAVELMLNESKITQKRMPAILDAGATWTGGTYNAKSVGRKIKETTADGRVIYQDTNNSLDDFQIHDTPVVRRNGAKQPSWKALAN